MSNTDDRNLACRTAPKDPERALQFARRIPDHWFRAQALSCVARYTTGKQVEQLAREALRTARQSEDAYKTTAVSAWPIRALIECDRIQAAEAALKEVLQDIPQIQPLASRAEALALLWQAVFPAGNVFRDAVLKTITSCCDPDGHWRSARLYRCVAWTFASENTTTAKAFVEGMPDGKAKLTAMKLLRAGKAYPPREFFADGRT